MKFTNFLKAFATVIITCSLLLFWYASEKTEVIIPADSIDESYQEEIEEPEFDFKKAFDDINNIESKPLEATTQRVNEYLSESSAENPKAAYLAYNLISGEYLAYNPDLRITGASVIKAAYCLYVLENAVTGNANLDEVLIYNAYDKRNGTGIIKDSAYGTEYTVKELITLSITESDNVAHKMLVDRFGRSDFNKFLDSLSIESLHLYSGGQVEYYNNLSCRDLARLFSTIYQKSLENDTFSWYLDIMKEAKYNRFSSSTEFDVAHKSGFMKGAFHDAGLVLADQPYVIIVLTNGNISEVEETFLNDLSAILCEYMEKKNP